MRHNRYACLLVGAALFSSLALAVPESNAKSEHAKGAGTHAIRVEPPPSFTEATPHLASPTIAAPTLQGTNIGTIGPPSLSDQPTSLILVNGVAMATSKKESPVIPTLLFASLAIGLVSVGVRSIVFKKRAPLFVLGLIAAGSLMLLGFMLSFYEPVTMAGPPTQPSLRQFRCGVGSPDGLETQKGTTRAVHMFAFEDVPDP